jgi:hypothetical protein
MVSYIDYFSDQKRVLRKESTINITMSTCLLTGGNNK